MDLEELNDNLQTSIELMKQKQESQEQTSLDILQELKKLQTSLKSTDSTEQTNELKSLKEFVFKMQDALQKSNSENLKKIVTDYSEQIKTISQSVVDDTVKAIRRNSETLNEETKKFNEELRAVKKTHFGFLANALLYVFVGAVIAVVVYIGFSFCQLKRASLKELAEQSAVESIEKKAVAEYKKELTSKNGIIELSQLEYEWAKDEKNIKWQDREKALQSFKKQIEQAKEWVK